MGNPTPTPAPDPAPAPAAWHAGLSPELVGHAQNRGWADKTPAEVAAAAVQAHYEAQKHLGVPPEQIVRWPKDAADEAGWKAVYARLGVPADPAGYDFTGIKVGETDLDPKLVETLRSAALATHLPPEAAKSVATALAKYQLDTQASDAAEKAAKLVEAKAALAANWGKNAEANLFVAKNTAAKLGVTPEQVAELENLVGYDKVMEMFRSIGEKTGEATFVQGQGGGGGNVMTAEQALARKDELKNDSAWVAKYLAGDQEAKRQMEAVERIIWSAAPAR
jgi:hypothetical protein